MMMMRKLLIIATLAVICCMVNGQNYAGKFDNVDIDAILKNDRILTNYVKCVLDKGPCTQEGRQLKKTLPDAITSDCSRCSPKQRENTNKVIRHLRERKPKEWKQLAAKYDPRGIYEQRYAAKGGRL